MHFRNKYKYQSCFPGIFWNSITDNKIGLCLIIWKIESYFGNLYTKLHITDLNVFKITLINLSIKSVEIKKVVLWICGTVHQTDWMYWKKTVGNHFYNATKRVGNPSQIKTKIIYFCIELQSLILLVYLMMCLYFQRKRQHSESDYFSSNLAPYLDA